MTSSLSYDRVEAARMLAFSSYAYIDETPLPGETLAAQKARMRKDIDAALSAGSYTGWQVAWGPALDDDRSNMMYVAGNAASKQYAVVIRGTDWTFWLDWLEDVAGLLGLVPFPYATGNTAQIAAGTAIGLDVLVQITGSAGTGGDVGLAEFLKPLTQSGATVIVTGHSLGGCLASVVAPWLASVFGSISTPDASHMRIYTFAAPSAGNRGFARFYNKLFTHTGATIAWRFYNSLDVVPNAWASLPTIKTYYDPFPPCPGDIKDVIDLAQGFVGTKYAQVGTSAQGSAVKLPGHILFSAPQAAAIATDPVGDALFLYEAYLQHGTATYASLLNAAPILPIQAKLKGFLSTRQRSGGTTARP
jgi:hypothetical protein